jgi:UDP-glucose 4-epimerase
VNDRANKVLITGGAGFIGANLVRLLLDNDHRVTIFDNDRSGAPAEYLAGLDVERVDGDITDRAALERAVPGHDAIVHLAAQAGVPTSIEDPEEDARLNVMGTLRTLDVAREAGVQRFVFASSNAPLGRQEPPSSEDKAPLPVSPYGASKLAGEAYCLAYNGSWGMQTIALRFANVYGPYSAHKTSVVAKFIRNIKRDGKLELYGGGEQTRDFVFVGDLCRAIGLALETDVGGEVFQLGTGEETSIQTLATLLGKIAGTDISATAAPPLRGDVQRSLSSIEKIKRVLGWEPETGLEEGLRATWDWANEWYDEYGMARA